MTPAVAGLITAATLLFYIGAWGIYRLIANRRRRRRS
jgi:hypothetical protein